MEEGREDVEGGKRWRKEGGGEKMSGRGEKGSKHNYTISTSVCENYNTCIVQYNNQPVLGSIVVSISACHAEDPGSIPGRGECSFPFLLFFSLNSLGPIAPISVMRLSAS